MQNKFFKLIFLLTIFFVMPNFTKASTTIEAKVVRNEAGSGNCLISNGFPVPEGLVTEQLIFDGKIKVIVNGSEVPANVSALRGRHQDGTLRSMLIQFSQTMSQNDEVSAQVIIDGGIRTENDPVYIRPTLDIVTNNNVILPTDKNYLVSTGITFRNVIPSGSGSVGEELLYTWAANDRFDWLMAQGSGYVPVSSYDQVEAIVGLWARTGDIKYQKAAVAHIIQLLPYSTPQVGYTPDCKDWYHIGNPDALTYPDAAVKPQACGISNEPQYARYYGYALMYLLTGYRDFWGVIAISAQYQQNDISSQALAFNKIIPYNIYDTPRFNAFQRYGTLLPAMIVDATIPGDGPYSSGRVYDWQNQLEWTIDTLEHWKWDFKWIPYSGGSGTVYTGSIPAETTGTITQGSVTGTLLGVYPLMHDEQIYAGNAMPVTGYLMVNNISGGSFTSGVLNISGGLSATADGDQITDHREGMAAGVRPNSPRGNYAPWDGTHSIPIFQLVFPTNFMIDYYLYFKADSRIPGMVKKNMDVILQSIRVKQLGDADYGRTNATYDPMWGIFTYVKNYKLENPPDMTPRGYPSATISQELPEYARMLAFVLKTSGEDTVNGATYTQWYERVTDTANVSPGILNWAWKYFGQFYSWGQDAPWMMVQPSLTNYGPATMRAPKQYNVIPADMPDISRNYSLESDATAPSAPSGLSVM